MQHIVDWLRKLGMSEYAERFVENRIDFSVLRDLTDQDLKDLGVVLGDRRKMRRAIAELDDAPAAAAPASGMEPQLRDAAERRQVTVMFSDLVGSTALSAQMDPEDLREVVSAYQKCVDETVRRFGGFVVKYMGDGVLVICWVFSSRPSFFSRMIVIAGCKRLASGAERLYRQRLCRRAGANGLCICVLPNDRTSVASACLAVKTRMRRGGESWLRT
jgi:class 3 adenylate cyclase